MVENKKLRKCLGSTTRMARLGTCFLLGCTRACDDTPTGAPPRVMNVRGTWSVVSFTTPR